MGIPLPRNKLAGIKNIIAIAGARGGTGKTFVATNLAYSLVQNGFKAAILDADIAYPSVFAALNIRGKLMLTADNKIVPAVSYGLKVVSMAGITASQDEPSAWRGPIVSKILQQFFKETLWGELDYLIVDLPAGAGDILLTVLQQQEIDGVYIVTAPQRAASDASKKTINLCEILDVPVIGIVENMRGEHFGEGGGTRLAEAVGAPSLCSIPMRKQIAVLMDNGQLPVANLQELEILFAKIARPIMEIASTGTVI